MSDDYGDDYRERSDNSTGSLLSTALMGGLAAIFFFAMLDSVWVNRVRYAVQYSVDMDKVLMEPKPHDCDFLKAPLGEKNCHFDKTVVPQTATNDATQVTGVYVMWTKVQD
jgi:hypothetical protein